MNRLFKYLDFLLGNKPLLKKSEITSTENLLSMIRKRPLLSENMTFSSQSHVFKEFLTKKQRITIAVDLRSSFITLVKVHYLGNNDWRLLDCKRIDNRITADQTSPEFIKLLRSILIDACGENNDIQIWSFIPSDSIDLRHIIVPKVSPNELYDTVRFRAKNELKFDENNNFFDFEVLEDSTEKGIGKIAVMVYISPHSEINRIKNIFQLCGFQLTGLSLPQFATQNLIRNNLLIKREDHIATLYVGSDFSQINIFQKGNLAFTRRIKACIHSMAETWIESIKIDRRNDLISKRQPFTIDEAKYILMGRKDVLSENQTPKKNLLDDDEVVSNIRPAIDRLIRQTERTFQHYTLNIGNENITQLYITGELSMIQPVTDYIREQLKIKIEYLNIFTSNALLLSQYAIPEQVEEQIRYTPAVGLALSKFPKTPNLLVDYKEKERIAANELINKSIRIALIAIIVLCIGAILFQVRSSRHYNKQIVQLKEELTNLGPRVDQELILAEAEKMKTFHQRKKKIANKFMGVAVIGELISHTPNHIRLLNINVNFESIAQILRNKKNDLTGTLVIEGIVFKENEIQRNRELYDTSLVSYVMSLEKSLIFKNPSVKEKSFEMLENIGEGLHFVMQLSIISTEE